MRQKLYTFLVLFLLGLGVHAQTLFFSEYIEGSSYNKAIEIYNGTGEDVSLDNYLIRSAQNGAVLEEATVYNFPAETVLKNGEVYVIANSQASSTILGKANDQNDNVANFNGDDARVLIRKDGETETIIDVIGNVGEKPEDGWAIAGTEKATKDHTLIRKSTVTAGNTDWTAIAGTNADDSEWMVKDKDDFTNLGIWGESPVEPILEVTIHDIQFTEDASGESPYIDKKVITTGIVTAIIDKKYFIQNGNTPWNGIFIFDPSNTPALGEEIKITGLVAEYYNLTQIKNIEEYEVLSSGNELPAPQTVTELNESIEGSLVKVENIVSSVAKDKNGNCEFASENGSVTVIVSHEFYSDFNPTVGNKYTITGTVTYSYGAYKLLPRTADDVVDLTPVSNVPVIYINEIMAKEVGEDGSEKSDWLELYNPGEEAIDLAGMYLTDDLDEPKKWQFPAGESETTTIAAGGYLVVFADEASTVGLHANFKFSKKGEDVGLFTAEGEEIDKVTFPEQEDNISYGRIPDGADEWSTMTEATPGAANKKAENEVSIYDIQFTEDASGNSPYIKKEVTTSGIVTAVTSKKYFIQDGDTPWSGIYIYDNKYFPAVGDRVSITGTVDEYRTLTQIKDVTNLTVISSNNALPTPILVTILDESLEGTFVKFENIISTSERNSFGECEFALENSTVGTIVLDDELYEGFTPTVGNKYTITGTVTYSYGAYKILPRTAADIVDLSEPSNIPSILVNEILAKEVGEDGSDKPDWIELYNAGSEDVDLAGMYLTDDLSNPTQWQFPADNAEMTTIPAKGYLVVYADESSSDAVHTNFKLTKKGEAVGLYTAAGEIVDTVSFPQQEDNISYLRIPDGSETWDFSSTPTPGAENSKPASAVSIRDIQYTTDEKGDSPFAGQEVITQGIVTGFEIKKGEMVGFYIQDKAEAWCGIYVYGKQEVALGDEIEIKGMVKEYNGLSEIVDATVTVKSSGNDIFEPILIGINEVGEQYEGVLVKVENVICTNDDAGYGNSIYYNEANTDSIVAYSYYDLDWKTLVGSKYSFIGHIFYSYGQYTIRPQSNDEVIEVSIVKNPPVLGTVGFDPEELLAKKEFKISVEATDDVELTSVILLYGTSEDNLDNEVALEKIGFSSNYGTDLTFDSGTTVYYKITATDSDDLTDEETGSFEVKENTGIATETMSQVKIYPNPVHDILFISNAENISKIEINNITGQTVATEQPNGINTIEINTNNFHAGIYLMKVEDKNGKTRVMKFIKR